MKAMKLKSIIIAVITLAGFAGNAKADTTKLLEADGWTKITTVPTTSDLANNYYVFVDNSSDLMLGVAKGVHQDTKWYSLGVYYQTCVEPTSAAMNGKTWIVEASGSGYSLRNLEYSAQPMMTEWNAAWKYDTNDVYTSDGEWTVTLWAYADGSWTIQNGKYPDSGYLGPWDNSITDGAECAANKTGDAVGHFQIYTISRTQFKQNLFDNASENNPVDLTPWYVTNATFDANNSDGWETSFSANSSNWWGSHTFNHLGAENYQQVGEVKQTLTLPNGKYKVSLQGASNKVSENQAYVYATHNGSTQKTYFTQSTVSTTDGYKWNDMQYNLLLMMQKRSYGQVQTPEVTVTTGSLTIGYKNENGHSWDVFDNFKLYCTGVDLSAYETQLSDLVNECNTFISSSVVPEACETAISSAITTYNQTYETAKEYSTAIVGLTAVLNTYRNDTELQKAYSDYYSYKATIVALTDGKSASDALTTFNTAVSNATTAVEAATTAAAITAQIPNLRSAGLTYISSVEGLFNITFLASQNYWDWKKKDGSNAGIVADQFLTNRPNTIPSFAECYETTCATTGTVLYQTIENLPAGYYQVGMYAAAMYTSGRGFTTEATEGDANRTYAFAGDLDDAESILRTGAPISFATSRNFDDLTTLDVNVHLSSTGDLTFGVQKDANGSNWHFAQIMSIIYSKSPDLTGLQTTRDALVAEATGIVNGADAGYLTELQQTALQTAISNGKAADTFNDLNTVTLTTLPNAINTAKQQIQQVKDNRVLMIAALERFENNYNLADGTDYSRMTMSAGAWTTLLTKVNAVTTALDDVSQASNYGTVKDELVAQMDATDASLRLFKSYKAMVDGATALNIAGSYGADSNMDTDATEQTAIAALNAVFGTYALTQTDDFSVAGFLGENLDFSFTAGSVINGDNSNTIKNVTGWEVAYTDADTWAVLQTDQSDNASKLYIRKNWGSAATTLKAFKQKMLPVGKYRLSLSWNSSMENMTNLSAYVLGSTSTAIGESTDGAQTLTYDFEVTSAATPFDLIIGFQKTGTGNTPAQLIVDDITLTALGASDLLLAAYDPAAAEFDATGFTGASDVTLDRTNANQIIYANSGQLTNTQNVVINGTCASLVVTDNMDIATTQNFTATTAIYTRTMAAETQYGTLILPYPITVGESDVDFFTLRSITTDEEGGSMTFTPVKDATIDAGTPLLFKKKTADATSITIKGSGIVPAISTSASSQQGNDGWTAVGYYQSNASLSGDRTYYIAGDHFWDADGNTLNMRPFRTVFVAPANGGAKARSFTICIDDGNANSIVNILSETELQGDIYTVSGQLLRRNAQSLSDLPRGIYIVSGKKVAIQ